LGRVEAPEGELFSWSAASSYIVEPPFFAMQQTSFATAQNIAGVRVLGIFGDNYTTDHASPGGEIPPDSPAGEYLQSLGVAPREFNSYVGRRGNHHVMARATYSNVRSRNRMVDGREGGGRDISPGATTFRFFGQRHVTSSAAFRWSCLRAANSVPAVAVTGLQKVPASGRPAVIARSFERIHRSNLIGVGIVPLLFGACDSVESLTLDGSEELAFDNVADGIAARAPIAVVARRPDGTTIRFVVQADVRSDAETDLLTRGGMFAAALDRMVM